MIEDIIDTGHTIAHLRAVLATHHPRSMVLCALLDTAARREVEVPVEYCGFVIPNRFVVGYGLDFAQGYRHLPHIAALDGMPVGHSVLEGPNTCMAEAKCG